MTTRDREALVISHLPQAKRIGGRLARQFALDFDDALQSASEGLILAAESFDSSRPEPFGAYANTVVRNHVHYREIRKGLDSGVPDLYRRIKRQYDAAQQAHPGATFDHLCNLIGRSARVVRNVLKVFGAQAFNSLDEPIGMASDGPTCLRDVIPASDGDPLESIMEDETRREVAAALKRIKRTELDAIRAVCCGEVPAYARRTGLGVRTVYDRYYRGINKIRREVCVA